MPEKIRRISDLPEWFHNRTYKKQLSDIDWYREIRKRQKILSLIELGSAPSLKMTEESRKILLEMLENDNVRPDSLLYLIEQEGSPVRDMTVNEAVYLAFSAQHSDVSATVSKYEKLLELWRDVIDEFHRVGDDGPTPIFGQYEAELAEFMDSLNNDKDTKFQSPIGPYFEELNNPWLSYGRPLNGYPVTIDTQFDDETILKTIKDWLIEKRKEEGVKARRPFNQSDFDNWEYYKIREIFDLQTWAILNDAKIIDRVLADVLWPNAPDDFSPIDTLRTTARKKTKEIFQFETVVRLYGQLLLVHGENFLLK